jgi:hypothetical protein
MQDWAAVVAAGLALPGVAQGSRYGRPALLFRGRMLAAATAPDQASFVLHVDQADKPVLIDTDPATFGRRIIIAAGRRSSSATAPMPASASPACSPAPGGTAPPSPSARLMATGRDAIPGKIKRLIHGNRGHRRRDPALHRRCG